MRLLLLLLTVRFCNLADSSDANVNLNLTERIVGGSSAPRSVIRHLALVEYLTDFSTIPTFCTGTVIANRWILSSASCYEVGRLRAITGSIRVFVGAISARSGLPRPKPFRVANIFIDKQFIAAAQQLSRAVAVLELTQPIPRHKFRAFQLPAQGASPPRPGSPRQLSGYGWISRSGMEPSERAQTARMLVGSFDECFRRGSIFSQSFVKRDVNMCISRRGTRVTAGCVGDAGGPVFASSNGGRTLRQDAIWVVGDGSFCGTAGSDWTVLLSPFVRNIQSLMRGDQSQWRRVKS